MIPSYTGPCVALIRANPYRRVRRFVLRRRTCYHGRQPAEYETQGGPAEWKRKRLAPWKSKMARVTTRRGLAGAMKGMVGGPAE